MKNDIAADTYPVSKLFITILIAGLNNSALAGGRLVLPMIALGMGASTFWVGLISAMFTALPMVLSIRFGQWTDRVGTLVPVAFSAGLIVLAGLVFLPFPSVYALLPVAGLIGTGAVFSHVAAVRAVGGLGNTSQRAKNLGYLVVSYSVFQFLAPVVAGVSYEWFGATEALLTIGGVGILSLSLILLHFHYYEQAPKQPRDRSYKRRTSELLLIGGLRKWIAVNGIFATAQILYPFVVSLHAVEVGLTAYQAGILLGSFAVGVLISRACVSMAIKYLRAQTLISTALFTAATIYAVLPLIHDMYPLIILSTLLGLPLGLGVPISLSLIYGAAPEGRINESIGLCMAVTNSLQTAAPLTLGIIASGPGSASMVWALTLVMVLVAVMSGRNAKG